MGVVTGAVVGWFASNDKALGAAIGALAGGLLGATVGGLVYSEGALEEAQADKLIGKVRERAQDDLRAVQTSMLLLRELERERKLILGSIQQSYLAGGYTLGEFASTLEASASLTAEEVAFVKRRILTEGKKRSKIYNVALRKAQRSAGDLQHLRQTENIVSLNDSDLRALERLLSELSDRSAVYGLRADACSGTEDTSDPGPSCFAEVK